MHCAKRHSPARQGRDRNADLVVVDGRLERARLERGGPDLHCGPAGDHDSTIGKQAGVGYASGDDVDAADEIGLDVRTAGGDRAGGGSCPRPCPPASRAERKEPR